MALTDEDLNKIVQVLNPRFDRLEERMHKLVGRMGQLETKLEDFVDETRIAHDTIFAYMTQAFTKINGLDKGFHIKW